MAKLIPRSDITEQRLLELPIEFVVRKSKKPFVATSSVLIKGKAGYGGQIKVPFGYQMVFMLADDLIVPEYRTICLCGHFAIGDYYKAEIYPFSHQVARISRQGRYAYNENNASMHDCALLDEKYRAVKELIGE